LYIHIPICAGKCLYCDFFSVPRATVPASVEQRLVGETIAQARFLLDALGRGREVSLETLYVGGGTPSALSRENLGRLLAEFRGIVWKEWTVEANPESIDEEFLDVCGQAGVSRLSMGIQSMGDAFLGLLGRPGSRSDNEKALGLLRSRWTRDLSLDFIAGIPGQTAADVRADLSILDSLPGSMASHASLYSLTLEPGTGLFEQVQEGRVTMNDPEHDEELWFAGKDELERRGFEHYEISNFCLPGKASKHNLRYWNLEPYLGVGPGAVSTLPAALLREVFEARGKAAQGLGEQGFGEQAVCRLSNPESIEGYLAGRDALWGMEVEAIQPSDFLIENLMMGLRLAAGIPADRLQRRFGRDFEELFPGLWERWVERGLALPVELSGGHPARVGPSSGSSPQVRPSLRLSEAGRLILNTLMAEVAGMAEVAERARGPVTGASGALPALEVHWP
jgi:oxygen-independent coproporphyrinogen-3 oxidase